ncbi:MAG: M20 family metallopeptidase [Eubacteriales bacterium]|nr:M20 family metallopeptidase [Eubacteriales bacterium]
MLTTYLQKEMVQWRRDLHRIPEIGNHLPQTSSYVKSILEKYGISYTNYMNGNGIVAEILGTAPGKCVMIRADMDALQIKEETGLPFASNNGNMHACGHDGHTAMALGAAVYLQQHNDFAGTVKIIFQPGEEYPGGALPMIEEGALTGVDAIFGMHEGWLTKEVPKGSIGLKNGAAMASMDRFLIRIHGKGGHGASPEHTNDPILIGSEIVMALQRLSSREVRAVDPIIVSVCRFSGGFNQNIIPSEVELEGTVRALNQNIREYLAKRIEEIASGIANVYGAKIEYTYDYKYPAVINNEQMYKLCKETGLALFGESMIYDMKDPLMGAEDFAEYAKMIPANYMFMSNPGEVDGENYPHHHCKFDIDEAYFTHGSTLFAQCALNYLKEYK